MVAKINHQSIEKIVDCNRKMISQSINVLNVESN